MSFQDDVKVLRDKQHTEDPVVVARSGLEPTRQEAQSALFDFRTLCDRLRPAFAAALEQFEQATRIGITERPLHNICQEAHRIMEGGVNSLRSIIARIDGLTAYECGQRHHLTIPGELRLARANFGGLQALADRLPAHVRALEKRVAEEAATAKPPVEPKTVTHGERDLMDAVRAPQDDLTPRPPALY